MTRFWRRLVPPALPRVVRRGLSAFGWASAGDVPVGAVDFGSLRRLEPIARDFGFRRGRPVDRYYIERFLGSHAADIRGRVLEIADSEYTVRFGGERVGRSDVLHAVPGTPRATLVGDLASGEGVPAGVFDCVICTQTLCCIYDVHGAVRTLHRSLRPGGVALVTLPGISQIARYDYERWGDFWRFTDLSARRLFAAVFPPECVEVETWGNVLTAVAFLHGVAGQELSPGDLYARDPDYQVTVAVRAVRPDTP